MKKRFLFITGVIGSIYTAIITILAFYATSRLMFMKVKDSDLILKREIIAKRFDEHWYESVRKDDFWVDSPNGYPLRAVFLRPFDTTKTVIICHGVTENKINSIKYARLFERLGFNSVIYDHRRHGDSGGKTTSFGYYEKSDLHAVVSSVRDRIGRRALLGVHGESMGAATTILYGGEFEDEADFYIVDCPFSDFTTQILHILRTSTPLRTSMTLRIANLFLKVRDGYTTKLVSPRQVISKIDKPMLFIHSLEDDFILPEMTKELFTLKEDKKKMKLFKKGAHAKSFNDNPEEYEREVHAFLNEYGFIS
ncbi:alpha/beta hydrolase [Sporosarcina sp. Sa2YVA2]|uniref:Alpha/beta hydrolase n=1 Tax=Sporosarcina quadrami TaxID=2762234 RepID=A0ABR8U6G7_9BACL|nr:alpha/beta hydrolase [Sporosarcina quadrami]MBD7983621.1 alpha/beta hydrolase [Sporosarcina quadrami]